MTRLALPALAALVLLSCSPETRPEAGSQTNWLLACDSSQECGDLECACGACSTRCESDEDCEDLPGASCIAESDEGAVALCGGQAPTRGICLPRCEESCVEGTSCVAGVCVPAGDPTVQVTIDAEQRHQTLVGFGASLAYADDAIVAHPDKDALYDLLFVESGLDVLRLRNRHDDGSETGMSAAREIIAAATERLERTPVLFMTSGTPPAALKANGSRTCGGDLETCTLATLTDGSFDYAGFAEHWRASLEAYAAEEIVPDYLSIQNNPNWVPPEDMPHDACRFLPEEGTTTETVGTSEVELAYPGYREALAAVVEAIAGLPNTPQLAAPEASSVRSFAEYVPPLDASAFDALALHFYGSEATSIDLEALEAMRALSEQLDHPVLQTEMQAGGLETAILIHHAVTTGGASAYLQNDLVYLTREGSELALALLTADDFEAQGPYYALAQYAKRTDPGWVRVDATSDSSNLLGSAWLAPDESALTVVLVNPGDEGLDAELVLPDALRSRLATTQVTRTVFDGVERSAELGELSTEGVLHVPAGAVVTIALTE